MMSMWDKSTIVVYTILVLSLPFIGAPVAYADRLLIPGAPQDTPGDDEDTPRPTRAMTMDEVLSNFGDPISVSDPVGKPPITRWVYDKFIVVFEHQYVIHSVVKSKLPKK